MITKQGPQASWIEVMRRYLGVSIAANIVWEVLQLPLFALWTTGTVRQQAFAVFHCTIGDAMIAGLSLLLALAIFAPATWPRAGVAQVFMASLAFGVGCAATAMGRRSDADIVGRARAGAVGRRPLTHASIGALVSPGSGGNWLIASQNIAFPIVQIAFSRAAQC